MQEKITLDRPVIVEGKYDKIKLSSIISGKIITTDGFAVFKSEEKKLLIRCLAEKNGVLVLTDSDGGGLVIRNYINSIIPKDKITHLYIPEIKGREKRKSCDSKEGIIGVEGIECEMLLKILTPFSLAETVKSNESNVTKTDLFEDGFCGGKESSVKRAILCRELGLPTNISSNALLEAINILLDFDNYKRIANKIINNC